MKYPTEADIIKMKKAQRQRPGLGVFFVGMLLAVVIMAAITQNVAQPTPLAYVPVTAIFASRTDAPTPTLAATATAAPTGTAVATETIVDTKVRATSFQMTKALATYTPAPTYTPLPTYTPEPTQTAAPTQTPLPTYTPAATYTLRPTPIIIVTYQTAVSDLTQARASLVWGLLSSLSLMLLSAAPLVYAWRHRPAAPVVVEGESISETAVRLPPPTWQPVRDIIAPVQNTGDTGVTTQNTGANREIPMRREGGETITIHLQPVDADVDAQTRLAICETWNSLERPSLTKTCIEYFGSKNAERLAIVRAAINWGREGGILA